MGKYIRYFKANNAELMEAVKECQAVNAEAQKKYIDILDQLGADTEYYSVENKLVAMTFKDTPDTKLFRRNKNTRDGWYPKKNCKRGKEIAQAIESIETRSVDDCLPAIGLYKGVKLLGTGYAYAAKIIVIPSDPMEIYISIPWYMADQAEIGRYYEAKSTDSFNGACLPWEPSEELIEVQEYVVVDAIAEWNLSLHFNNQKNV